MTLDRLGELLAVRALLDATLREAKPSEVASLVKQLRETLAEIEGLESRRPAEGSKLDELAGKRVARGAKAAPAGRAGRRRGVSGGA